MEPEQHILLVDDDADLLEMVTHALQSYHFKVSVLQGESQLYSFLQNEKPHAILMDVYWAGKDGRTICRQLKLTPEYKDIPVILYSAGDISDDSIRHSLANHFFPKPFDIQKLSLMLQKLITQATP